MGPTHIQLNHLVESVRRANNQTSAALRGKILTEVFATLKDQETPKDLRNKLRTELGPEFASLSRSILLDDAQPVALRRNALLCVLDVHRRFPVLGIITEVLESPGLPVELREEVYSELSRTSTGIHRLDPTLARTLLFASDSSPDLLAIKRRILKRMGADTDFFAGVCFLSNEYTAYIQKQLGFIPAHQVDFERLDPLVHLLSKGTLPHSVISAVSSNFFDPSSLFLMYHAATIIYESLRFSSEALRLIQISPKHEDSLVYYLSRLHPDYLDIVHIYRLAQAAEMIGSVRAFQLLMPYETRTEVPQGLREYLCRTRTYFEMGAQTPSDEIATA